MVSFTWFELAVVPCFSIAGVGVVNLSMGMHFCLSLWIIHKDKSIFLIQAELVWPTPGVIGAAVCRPRCCCSGWRRPRPVAGAAWLALALLHFCVLAYACIVCLGVTAVLFVGFLPWIGTTGDKVLLESLVKAWAFSLLCCCFTACSPTGNNTAERGTLHAGISEPFQRFSSCQQSHHSYFLHFLCTLFFCREWRSLAEAISYNSPSDEGYDRQKEQNLQKH